MASRSWLILTLVGIEGALVAGVACGSFSGSDTAADVDASGDASIDGAPAESGATGPVCVVRDGAPPQPPANLTKQTCNGVSGLDLSGDSDNCGWCGHVCGANSACDGSGRCKSFTFYTGAAGELLATIDDIGPLLYFAALAPGRVMSVPTGALGAPTDLTDVPDAEPQFNWLYNASIGDRITVRTFGNLETAPLDGGPLAILHAEAKGAAYLIERVNHIFETSGDTFQDMTKDGTPKKTITNVGGAADLTVTPSGDYVFFIARTAADGGLDAATSTPVGRGALYRYTIASGASQQLMEFDAFTFNTFPIGQSHIAADNEYVFFAEASNGDILRLPVAANPGDTATVLSKGNGRSVTSLASDADRVYWLQGARPATTTELHAVSRCGGADYAYTSATNEFIYQGKGLIAAPQHLYFATDNKIERLAK